ncbi:MAG TPA: AmmeMemoRadiSam system radical SAM enzyme [Candidatus Omnitrophota bacterium]|nr:AmmeMemoRadiSam system radical SAM enzyme [Candidatus Omnitrophota bacterium]
MNKIIECELCPRHCRLAEGERGDCRVRIHLDGELKTLAYANPCSVHIDPIEKKPLYHVLPTSGSFSIATAGCNLHCKYCQNWQISQRPPEETQNYELSPEAVVREALSSGCRSIAYTYSDPIIFYEYVYDTARLAKDKGLLNVFVTAGYIEQPPLKKLCPYLDAANVDLKGITDEFYQSMSDAHLKPVQDCILTMKRLGVWVEITNLVVPTWNDSPGDVRALVRWVKESCGADTPLHFSKFSPMHQLKNLPPTPVSTLDMAWEIAKSEGLHYAYIGNIPGHPGNNTYCPGCKNILIKRIGYTITENHLADGRCEFCQHPIAGIWTR